MRKNVIFDTDNYTGAIVVLENYLDGALADYENGDVENDSVIEDTINALELLGFSLFAQYGSEYRERFEKAKEKKGGE